MNIIKKARKEKGLSVREVAYTLRIPLVKYIYYEIDYGAVEALDALSLSIFLNFSL